VPNASSVRTIAGASLIVRSACGPTPLVQEPLADGRKVLLKREDLGPTGSFKWRGSLSACYEIAGTGARGVATASTGNHGASVAWAASLVGLEAHVVVPEQSSETKRALITEAGAVLHCVGESVKDADAHARELAQDLGLTFFEDGGRLSQVLGAATLAVELTGASAVDAVIIPVGCGALAAGIGLAMRGVRKRPHLVGVQSRSYARLAHVFADREYARTGGATLADGLADDRLIEPACSLCLEALDDLVLIDEASIAGAIRKLWETTGIVAEGAGAAALAALDIYSNRIPGSRVALIVSGSNIDPELFESVLEHCSPNDGESFRG
jgi:threonine dehydratase